MNNFDIAELHDVEVHVIDEITEAMFGTTEVNDEQLNHVDAVLGLKRLEGFETEEAIAHYIQSLQGQEKNNAIAQFQQNQYADAEAAARTFAHSVIAQFTTKSLEYMAHYIESGLDESLLLPEEKEAMERSKQKVQEAFSNIRGLMSRTTLDFAEGKRSLSNLPKLPTATPKLLQSVK